MKILQLAKFPPNSRGGIEKLVNQISSLLSASSVRIDILCFDENTKSRFDVFYTHTVYKARSLFTFLSTPFSIHNLYFLHKLVQSYDLIHVHLPNPLSALYALTLPQSKKISVHFHAEARNLRLYKLYRFIERKVLDRASLIICTSPYLANSPTLSSYSNKVKVVPLGLSSQDYEETPSSSVIDVYKHLSSCTYFMFLGRFSKYKNIPLLIDAFSKFRSLSVSSHLVKLVIAGSGSQYNEIVAKLRTSDFEDDIIVVDNPDDHLKRYILEKSIAPILPSTSIGEAFGYVQLEYMAMSTPVISFKIPHSGVSFVNEHMVSGISLPTPDTYSHAVDQLCDAMKLLFESESLCSDLSVGAKNRSKLFRVEDTLEYLLNAFREA